MTREEIIRQKAISEQRDLMESCDWRAGFIAGAKWADKTMIEKACDWLKENIDLYSYNAFNTTSCYTEIKLTDVFETAFRQAMEE